MTRLTDDLVDFAQNMREVASQAVTYTQLAAAVLEWADVIERLERPPCPPAPFLDSSTLSQLADMAKALESMDKKLNSRADEGDPFCSILTGLELRVEIEDGGRWIIRMADGWAEAEYDPEKRSA